MPDFEAMPVGTREAITEAAALFRSYEQSHSDRMQQLVDGGARDPDTEQAVDDRRRKAERNRLAAEKLEALLAVPTVDFPTAGLGKVQFATLGGVTFALPEDGRADAIRSLADPKGAMIVQVPSDSAWQPPETVIHLQQIEGSGAVGFEPPPQDEAYGHGCDEFPAFPGPKPAPLDGC